MTSDSIDWDEEIPADPKEEYQALVRALTRKQGFGLFFVRCSQQEGKQLIKRVKQDIPHKTIEVLRFVESIDNLYSRVAKLDNRDKIDILFIEGLEYSLYEYELKTFGKITELHFDDFTNIPRILNHLNQQRERFRDDFNICFVFLVRPFALKYFLNRAPDFFDWKSAIFEFSTDSDVLKAETRRLLKEGEFNKYLNLSLPERVKKILTIQDLLTEDKSNKLNLLFELGKLLIAAQEYEEAVVSFDRALKIQPWNDAVWTARGFVLDILGRYEEAIDSYDRALRIKPDYCEAWYNRGIALKKLERYQEAITSFDQALKIKPDYTIAREYKEYCAISLAVKPIESWSESVKKVVNQVIPHIDSLNENLKGFFDSFF
jgi:hypothetical protein